MQCVTMKGVPDQGKNCTVRNSIIVPMSNFLIGFLLWLRKRISLFRQTYTEIFKDEANASNGLSNDSQRVGKRRQRKRGRWQAANLSAGDSEFFCTGSSRDFPLTTVISVAKGREGGPSRASQDHLPTLPPPPGSPTWAVQMCTCLRASPPHPSCPEFSLLSLHRAPCNLWPKSHLHAHPLPRLLLSLHH